jgi:aryl-phospho-beta-D-glucosidase BglC (GH1 family)
MKLSSILTAFSLSSISVRAAWPNGPFKTSGRWLLDASGSNVTYAGVNWPAHVETMLPEGLQYQSIDSIVSQIKSLGMNAVRLTWAVQMVDEIYANGGQDVDIRTAFVNALGQENGTAVLQRVLKNNPSFSEGTTRIQVHQLSSVTSPFPSVPHRR